MSDILEEIQALSDKFSNLFEVDDLGNPAVDVPPSQNKIKRDRKTKDGKVEVVSVEDELFPYEGNKREQYRQKIIDIINNMIQGTATLEDLLQFVRQKKAPLKEAMELMENIYSQIKKVHGEPEYEEKYNKETKEYDLVPKNTAAELEVKAEKNRSKEFSDAVDREHSKQVKLANKQMRGLGDILDRGATAFKVFDNRENTKAKTDELRNLVKGDDKNDPLLTVTHKKAPLKEDMEVLEQLLSEEDFHARKGNPVVKITDKNYKVASGKSLPGPFNKNHIGQYIVYNKDTDASYLVTPDNWNKSKIKRDLERQGKVYEELIEILEAIKSRNINDIPDNEPVATSWKNDDGSYKVVAFANKKGKLTDKETNQHVDGKTFKSSKAADKYALKKGYNVHSFDEALSILENIYAQISKVHGDSDKADKLTARAEENAAREEQQAVRKKVYGTSMTYPEGADFIDKKRNETKNKPLGDRSYDTLSHMYDFKDSDDAKAEKAINKSKGRNVRKQIKDSVYSINKNESLTEAIINEVSDNLARKVHNARMTKADDAFWDEDEKFQKYAQARKELRETPGYVVGRVNLEKAENAIKAQKDWEDSKKTKDETRKKLMKNQRLMDMREALDILETALDAIKKSDKSDEEKSILKSKLLRARGAERRLADEKAWKSWAKGDLKNPDVDVIRDSEFTKNSNGERKTRIRSGHYDKMGNSKYKPEWKQVEDSIKRHEKKENK